MVSPIELLDCLQDVKKVIHDSRISEKKMAVNQLKIFEAHHLESSFNKERSYNKVLRDLLLVAISKATTSIFSLCT